MFFLTGVTGLCLLASCEAEQSDYNLLSSSPADENIRERLMVKDNSAMQDVELNDQKLCFSDESPILDSPHNVAECKSPAKQTDSSNTTQVMLGYGYTSTSIAAVRTRYYYSSTSSITREVGLPGGTYFVEVVKVTKTLPSYRAGDIIAPCTPVASDRDMGTRTCGFSETTLGWTTDETIEDGDMSFVGATYLIHFLYTVGGAQLDKYYPCRPENIVWRYKSILY